MQSKMKDFQLMRSIKGEDEGEREGDRRADMIAYLQILEAIE